MKRRLLWNPFPHVFIVSQDHGVLLDSHRNRSHTSKMGPGISFTEYIPIPIVHRSFFPVAYESQTSAIKLLDNEKTWDSYLLIPLLGLRIASYSG